MSGVGLHSGNKVSMTIHPSGPETGILFRRVDLDGKPEIPALLENVFETNRSTTLGKGNVRVHTVEHILAALSGSQIHNAIIELDASEPPVGDGSAKPYMDLLAKAGRVPQESICEPYQIQQPIELQLAESVMNIFPHDRFKITCTSADKDGNFVQVYSLEITPESWEKEISLARTFCFFEEIEYLIKHGLIKGGSLENAVVIRDDAVLTTEPLRYLDEFVRHKILDIIGDLSLIGKPIRGHVMAVRPGHASNVELARKIRDQMLKPLVQAQSFAPPPEAQKSLPVKAPPKEPTVSAQIPEARETVLDVTQVMGLLPHRYPFLMVDRIVKIDGNRIVAIKNVSINEPYFAGHFPMHPIMPGVLQLEAIAQVAGILMLQRAENSGKIAYFMSAESVKWRKPVRPGDVLVIDINLHKTRGKIGKAKGICLVNEEVVSEADVTFMLADP